MWGIAMNSSEIEKLKEENQKLKRSLEALT